MTEPVGATDAADPGAGERLDSALARLMAALTVLEVAVGRRLENDHAQADLNEAFAAMQDDRSRLALELDGALARGRKLESANEEVARRLEAAGATLAALARESGGGA